MNQLIVTTGIIAVILAIFTVIIYNNIRNRKREQYNKEVEKRERGLENDLLDLLEDIKHLSQDVHEHQLKEDAKYINTHSLESLISAEAEDEDYVEFLELISDKVRELYTSYNFSLYEPNKGDYTSGYMMQFQISNQEDIFQQLFVETMNKGLDLNVFSSKFADHIADGKVIPLGCGLNIKKSGTGIPPIGGREDMNIMITFTTDEYEDAKQEQEDMEELV